MERRYNIVDVKDIRTAKDLMEASLKLTPRQG